MTPHSSERKPPFRTHSAVPLGFGLGLEITREGGARMEAQCKGRTNDDVPGISMFTLTRQSTCRLGE